MTVIVTRDRDARPRPAGDRGLHVNVTDAPVSKALLQLAVKLHAQ
jgi:hypothetical protein